MPNETLLSDSTVLLFGRDVDDLEFNPAKHKGGGVVSTFLSGARKELARIYSFSYQNEFVHLASPALFLVKEAGKQVTPKVADTLLSRIPDTLAQDLLYWEVDRDDIGVRLDVMTGSIGRILLDYELAEGGLQDFTRGGGQVGQPSSLSPRGRGRRWRSDDD